MNSAESKVQRSRQLIWICVAISLALAALTTCYLTVRAYRQQQLFNILRSRHHYLVSHTLLPSQWDFYLKQWLGKSCEDVGCSTFTIQFDEECDNADLKLTEELFVLTYWNPAAAQLGCDLRGTKITDAGLKYISRFHGIQHLDLGETAITDAGLVHLKDMSGLSQLELNDTSVTGTGLSHFRNLLKLETLDLSRSPISDEGLMQVANVKNLRSLTLDETEISGAGLHGLTELVELHILEIRFADSLKDGELAKLSLPSSLTVLDLNSSCVGSHGLGCLKPLKNLYWLQLAGTPISDSCIDQLAHLTNLHDLWIYGSQISEPAAQRVRNALPKAAIHY